MKTTKVIRKIEKEEFSKLIQRHKTSIIVSPHAFDHLSTAQRNKFTEEDLLKPLRNQNPSFIGLQKNGRYIVFFKEKEGYLAIVIADKTQKLEIVTFMNKDNLPILK